MMDFHSTIKDFSDTPLSRSLILDLLKDYKSPNDKISELIKNGDLISIRRGLYVVGSKINSSLPNLFLIANHLRGPSYVSLESALSYWGLIPEKTYEVSSVTTKTPKKYKTKIGRFSYRQLPIPYFSFGIKNVEISSNQTVLMASPEKALCDKIVLTPYINLRSIRQTQDFLLDDLRVDDEILASLNSTTIESWIEDAPKKKSLSMLIKTLKKYD